MSKNGTNKKMSISQAFLKWHGKRHVIPATANKLEKW